MRAPTVGAVRCAGLRYKDPAARKVAGQATAAVDNLGLEYFHEGLVRPRAPSNPGTAFQRQFAPRADDSAPEPLRGTTRFSAASGRCASLRTELSPLRPKQLRRYARQHVQAARMASLGRTTPPASPKVAGGAIVPARSSEPFKQAQSTHDVPRASASSHASRLSSSCAATVQTTTRRCVLLM